MSVTAKQKRWLNAQAHPLKPVVLVGQAGVTDAVLAELDRALDHHELLKVRVASGDRDLRDSLIERMVQETGADLVGRVGNVATLYRPSPSKPDPLPLPPP